MDDRVTIADVAREAGVSRQTVSRTINNKGEISPVTLAHVRRVIDRLGYRPSSVARSLSTRRTLTIGLVIPDIANPFFSEIARGAEDAAHAARYGLLLCNTVEEPAREVEILATLEDKRVDGVVLCSSRLPDEQLAACIARHAAVVLINRTLPGVSSVCVDDASGATQAVGFLFRNGRRRIGFLAGPMASASGRRRMLGYTRGLAEVGLPDDPALESPCQPNYAGGREAALRVLTARPDVDALYCYNDLVAAGALQACAEVGRRVPADVAVVGCDDILLAALVTPPLTTLRVDKRHIGAAALDLLLDQINGRNGGCRDIVVQPELLVRATAP